MRLCKIIVFRMRPKLQIGCSIDGKKGKLCIGKVYFFSQKKLLQYIKYFSWSRWTRNFPGTCIPSPSPKFLSCSITASFQLLKLVNLLEFAKWKMSQLTHFIFLHVPRIYRSKWYIVSKRLIIAAEVSCSSNAVFVLSIFRKYFLLRVFL